MDYQVIVVGAGPGGYVAAIRAAQLGMKTALIEKDRVGGVCLNRGCIPTKTLEASALLYHQIKRAGEYGIGVEGAVPDWGRIMARKDGVVGKLGKGVEFLLKKNKVDLISGTATFTGKNTVKIELNQGGEKEVTGENIIIATGSQPITVPALGYNGKNVVTSEEALSLKELPGRMVIIGGGVIGSEFACIFAEMGVEVTVIELLPRILPPVEEELSKYLTLALKKRGIKILAGTKVQEVKETSGGPVVTLESGESIESDLVLLSLGRRPDTGGLGLDKTGVAVENGRVQVNDRMQTNVPGIYAVGDVTDVPYDLAHVASAQGIVAVENIAGVDRKMNYRAVPNCIFTIPEVATVGLSVAEAEKEGYKVKTGRFPMMASGKALAMGETKGFVMMVTEEGSGRILGVHMMGPHVTDLIAEAALAMEKGLTAEDIAHTIHAHPTVAETVMEAAEAALDRAIHI